MYQKRKILNRFNLLLVLLLLIINYGCTTTPTTPTITEPEPIIATGLTITATTISSGGKYAPTNVVAIWVEDNSGKFIKTLYVKAAMRINNLTKWKSASSSNKTDAVTGATRTGHGTIYATWNGTDTNKKVVADGTYKIWMEMTENESTGANTSFTFVKGAAAENKTAPDAAYFSNINSSWMPL